MSEPAETADSTVKVTETVHNSLEITQTHDINIEEESIQKEGPQNNQVGEDLQEMTSTQETSPPKRDNHDDTVVDQKIGIAVPTEEHNIADDSASVSQENIIEPEPAVSKAEPVDFLDKILEQAPTSEVVESDSESSSSDESDSDEDDNDEEFVDALDEEEDANSTQPIKSKNEVEDAANELPEDFKLTDNDAIEHVGEIISMVDKNIVVKGNLSGEFRFLKEGSVLCLEDRTPIGYLHEVFGPVSCPMYRVKFNTDEGFERFKDKKKAKVYYVVPKSSFVYTDSIKALKGSDASNWHDEEVPEDEQEFSDDEKETQHKKSKKRRKNKDNGDEGESEMKPVEKRQTHHNKWKQDRKPHQGYNSASAPQAQANLGYQSRSQRENLNNNNGQASNNFQPPAPFRPPPGMMNPPQILQGMPMQMPPFFPMIPPMPQVAQSPQNMNPAQFQQMQQQFFSMQQMMMQQFLAQQQGNGGNPQGSTDNNQ